MKFPLTSTEAYDKIRALKTFMLVLYFKFCFENVISASETQLLHSTKLLKPVKMHDGKW